MDVGYRHYNRIRVGIFYIQLMGFPGHIMCVKHPEKSFDFVFPTKLNNDKLTKKDILTTSFSLKKQTF